MKKTPGIEFKIIDLTEEQQKPIMPVHEYTEELENLEFNDFLMNSPVYDRLLEVSHYQPGLYDQYSAVLREVAISKGCTEKYVDDILNWIKIGGISFTGRDSEILDYIHVVASDLRMADKVSVLPLMCGTGKSTALTLLIKETIERIEKAEKRFERAQKAAEKWNRPIPVDNVPEAEYDGLLIVTDSKERLKRIWKPDPDNRYINKKTREFIEKHGDKWVTTITEENTADEGKQRYTPVLCITTQRYFGWKREEIINHLEWQIGETRHKRPLIVFDEQPYLNEVRDISVKEINDIDTALRTCLDDEVSQEKKQWCCEQWDIFRSWFFGLLRHCEYDFDGADTFYYQPKGETITEDDEQFFSFIETHRKKLRAKDNDAYKDLLAVRQMMSSWSIFSHRGIATGEYSNKFTVYLDNRKKVTDLGAKVLVLDGTGDVSPIYFDQDYIDMRSGVSFLRSLSYLTVILGDFATGKEQFRRDGNNVASCVKAFLKKEGHEQKDVIFFTYKGKESKFQARVNGKAIGNVAHFGDIKGKNDFTDKTCFAHVGLYRMQPVHYLVHLLGRHDDLRQDLVDRDPLNAYEQIQAIYQDDRFADFMTAHILADVDQCLFRSAIRNAGNMKNVSYYLFYKQSQYPRLRKAIEDRYKKRLGANIRPVQENAILDAAEAGKKAAKIRKWAAEWDGKPKKFSEILEELHMNRRTFYSTVSRDPELNSWVAECRKNAREQGRPNGWYAQKCIQE